MSGEEFALVYEIGTGHCFDIVIQINPLSVDSYLLGKHLMAVILLIALLIMLVCDIVADVGFICSDGVEKDYSRKRRTVKRTQVARE
jgi:hypothetical protein